MRGDADVASPAALIGDPTRAAFLLALAEQDALPASELAARAGVSNSTASIQLGKLVAGGLVTVERRGRHRQYRLAGPNVAGAIEALALIAPQPPVRSLRGANRAAAIRQARTCYDHLAGALGVSLTEALFDRGLLERDGDDVRFSENGDEWFSGLGVDLEKVRAARRPPARLCLDWSERRYHLAGGLGAALARRLFELGWIERAGPTRAVRVTPKGRAALQRELGVAAPGV
jgi:DNA-binding transcriptional ArsR family regulator